MLCSTPLYLLSTSFLDPKPLGTIFKKWCNHDRPCHTWSNSTIWPLEVLACESRQGAPGSRKDGDVADLCESWMITVEVSHIFRRDLDGSEESL